jgi:hypothetical protein
MSSGIRPLPYILITYQALFNVMLREFGVEGIKVQEVVSLEDGMMALLPYVSILLSVALLRCFAASLSTD